MITVVIFCYHKHKFSDNSSTDLNSSSSSSSSSSTVHVPHSHHHRHHHVRPVQHSHYAGAFRSPPPPYITNDQPENVFVTPSLPPPYESHSIVNESHPPIPSTVINVEPAESNDTQSSIHPPTHLPHTFDASSTLTNPSLQTFQVWSKEYIYISFLRFCFFWVSYSDGDKCAFFSVRRQKKDELLVTAAAVSRKKKEPNEMKTKKHLWKINVLHIDKQDEKKNRNKFEYRFYVTKKKRINKGKSCMSHRDSTNKLSARTNE